MLSKTLVLTAVALLAPVSASSFQKRDSVDVCLCLLSQGYLVCSNANAYACTKQVFIWASANFTDYTEFYTFAPGACQAVTTPS